MLLISQTAFVKDWSKNKTGCQLFFRDFSRRGKIPYNQYCISIFNSFQKLYWIWHRFIGLYICIWGRGHPRWIQEVDPRWSPCMNKEKFDSFRQKSSHFLLSHHHLFYNNFFFFSTLKCIAVVAEYVLTKKMWNFGFELWTSTNMNFTKKSLWKKSSFCKHQKEM